MTPSPILSNSTGEFAFPSLVLPSPPPSPLREKIPGSPPLELYQYWYVLIQEKSLSSFPEILRIS